MIGFYERAQDALNQIPGVRAVAVLQYKLLSGGSSQGNFFTLPAHPQLTGRAHHLDIGETSFATLGIPLRLGRNFTAADTDGAPKVVVVNDAFAHKYFTGEHPLGQSLKIGDDEWQIVGVCGDAKYDEIKDDVPPTVYFSYRQSGLGSAYFAVRTALPPLTIVSAVRKAVASVNVNIPLADIATQESVRDGRIAKETMFATLVGLLAVLAVLLSCIGLYGLMAYNVAGRTSEIGIRMALGATPRLIARPILREAILMASTGVAIGIPIAVALAQIIKSQLYGVSPVDPLTLASGGTLLITVSILAAWLPARRATRINPIEALRAE
jgi:predicted permease